MVAFLSAMKRGSWAALALGSFVMATSVCWAQAGRGIVPAIPPLRGQPLSQRPPDTPINIPTVNSNGQITIQNPALPFVTGFVPAQPGLMPGKPPIVALFNNTGVQQFLGNQGTNGN